MKDEPYILRLCVNAFSTNPGDWGATIRHVSQLPRDLQLPQSSVRLWHDIFSVCLDKYQSFKAIPTAALSASLLKKINDTLSYKIIDTEKQLQSFILKTTCVLLRMGFLNNDPKLAHLGFVSGCVRTNVIESNVFGDSEMKDMIHRIKDGLTADGNFENNKVLNEVLSTVRTVPYRKLKSIAPLIKVIIEIIIAMYDYVYFEFASSKSGKLPLEFLLLFTNAKQFEMSLFFIQTKRLVGNQSINLSRLQNIALKQSTSPESSLSKGYLKYIYHAKTLLHFFKTITKTTRKTKTLTTLINILTTFEKRAPKELSLMSEFTIDIGRSITKEYSKDSSDNMTRMALASQLFGRKS